MLHPIIKWAQRKDKCYIEIGLRDVVEDKIDLSPTKISFNGVSDKKKYGFEIELYQQIDVQDSKWNKTGFHITVVLSKKDINKDFWPRLQKSTVKNQYIQIDWAKWVDEDGQQEQADKGLGGMDPSQMQGFPGMGGMQGMPGMGGMQGMPGMGGMGDQDDEEEEEGNLDDLEKEQEIQPPKKSQNVKQSEKVQVEQPKKE